MNGSRKEIAFTAGWTWGVKYYYRRYNIPCSQSIHRFSINRVVIVRLRETWRKFVTPGWLNGFLRAIKCVKWYEVTKIYNQIWTHFHWQIKLLRCIRWSAHCTEVSSEHSIKEINYKFLILMQCGVRGRGQEINSRLASCFSSHVWSQGLFNES